MDDDDLELNEQPFSFTLFNRDALLKSANTQFSYPKIKIDPASFLVGDEFHFPGIEEINGPKKRGRRKKVPLNKDINDPTVTLKEIIENDQYGIPTEDEKRRQEEKMRNMKEKRAKGKQQPAADQTEAKSQTTVQQQQKDKANEENSIFPHALVTFKDGKVVMEQNLAPLPSFSEKVHELAVTKPKTLNSMSYRQKAQGKKWTEQENREFFKLLKICGTDFSMMARLFETRNRNEFKNKFRREEKQNPAMVDAYLKKNLKFNSKILSLPLPPSQPKQLTNGQDESNQSLANKNGDENDDFFKKPSIVNNISGTSSIDSVDFRIINKLKDLLNEELKLTGRSPSQIGLTGLNRPPALERKGSHDLDEIPTVNGNSVIFGLSKPETVATSGNSLMAASTRESTFEASDLRKSDSKTPNHQEAITQGPKNLFFM